MPKKQTKTLVIILLLINIVSIGVFVFIFSYTKSLIAESIKGTNDIKASLKIEETKILMKDDLSSGEKYQEKLSKYILPKGGTVDFIKTLEQLVSNSGLKYNINNVSSATYDKGNALGEELLKINIDVSGEWKNVQFFIKTLENYPLKIDISRISLDKFSEYTVKGKNIPQWSGTFDFTVVKMKETK